MNRLVKELRRRTVKDFGPTAVLATAIPGGDSFAYSSPDARLIASDDAEMSHEFVVVSDVEDREGDIIDPQGCVDFLRDYQNNPVWLLEHDPKEPIGTCRDRSGAFHLRVEPRRIVAKCFYNNLSLRGDQLSLEVYRAVKAGLFIGASPGFLPVEAKKRGYAKDDGYHYTKWRLTELSQTCQPVNQEALRASLSRGIVKSLGLKHRLESLLIKPAPVVNGATLEKAMKPKIAKIEYDRSVFKSLDQVVADLKARDLKSDAIVELAGSFMATQRPGKANAGRKSIANGITGWLTKAVKPDDDEDDDDDDLEPADADNDAADPPVETEESETPEKEPVAGNETVAAEDEPTDQEALKAEAQDLANVVTHFKMLLENLPEMQGRAGAASEHYTKLATDISAIVTDLSACFGENYADVALDAMAGGGVETPSTEIETPADTTSAPDAMEDEVKKSLRIARSRIAKAMGWKSA